MAERTSKAISAENTWTDPVYIEGYFNLSISGTFSATVTVQRSYDKGSNWVDVDSFTAPAEEVGFDPEYCKYRIGCKSGEYSSGTVNIRIGHEDHEMH